MFPKANSNLRELRYTLDLSFKRDTLCRWFLQEALGLSSALAAMHNTEMKGSSPGISAQVLRHGDIKPENILVMGPSHASEDDHMLDHLLLTDMGVTVNMLDTTSHSEIKAIGSLSFDAPEEQVGEIVTCRTYIWSLGCVFLEFMIWLMDGSQAVVQFGKHRIMPTPNAGLDFLEHDHFFMI